MYYQTSLIENLMNSNLVFSVTCSYRKSPMVHSDEWNNKSLMVITLVRVPLGGGWGGVVCFIAPKLRPWMNEIIGLVIISSSHVDEN